MKTPLNPRWWYVLLLVPFIVYLKGLAPSTVFGDTGDYQTAGWIWGVSHPPGYPLYTMLVGLVQRIPIPPIWIQVHEYSVPAWRSNLLSAIFAVGALAVMFALVNRLTRKPVAALIAAGALAFSRVFWWHAEIAENDALSCLFILLIFLIAVRIVQEKRPGDPYLLAILIGLGISHHQAIILFLPAVAVWLVLNKSLNMKPVQWIGCVLVFILGLAPFLYLPIVEYRSINGPLNFVSEAEYSRMHASDSEMLHEGRYTTKSKLEYFVNFVGRQVYAKQREFTRTEEALGDDVTTSADVFIFYVNMVNGDFGYLLAFLGFLGIVLGARPLKPLINRRPGVERKRQKKKAKKNEPIRGDPGRLHNWLLLFTAWGLYFLVIHFVPSGDILRAPHYNLLTAGYGLMLPLNLIFAVFIGAGTANLMASLEMSGFDARKVRLVVLVLGIIALAVNLTGNYRYGDRSGSTLAHEYGLNVLDSCPENAVLVLAGDEMYPFLYLHNVHPNTMGGYGYRSDVKLTTWSGEIESFSELADVGGAMAQAIIRMREQCPDREVNTTFFNSRFLEEPELQDLALARRGLVFAFEPPDYEEWLVLTSDQLSVQTGVFFHEPDLPETYRWDFWGGNAISNPDMALVTESDRWLWEPEVDIQWRIGEMLIFYGTDALVSDDNEKAMGYFRQLMLVEPGNPEAQSYLEIASQNP